MGLKPEELAIVLDEAKQYADSAKIAGVKKNVYTLDLDKVINSFTKVSEEKFKNVKFNVLSVNMLSGENSLPAPTEYISISNPATGVHEIAMVRGEQTLTLVIIVEDGCVYKDEYDAGVWFMTDRSDELYVKEIILETIHQIDQKLIPGYIPVIELENIMEVPASVAENLKTATDHKAAGQLLMTEDEIAIATEAMRTDSPIVLKIKTRLPPDGDGVQTVVMNRVNNFLTWEFDIYQYAGWTHAGLVFMCLDDEFPKCVMQLFGCFTVTECRKYILEQNA